jgi:hypothetical protein
MNAIRNMLLAASACVALAALMGPTADAAPHGGGGTPQAAQATVVATPPATAARPALVVMQAVLVPRPLAPQGRVAPARPPVAAKALVHRQP